MVMGNLNSISAKQLSSAVKKAAEKSTHLKITKAPELTLATLRPPIIGFILRDLEAKASLGELNQLASDVAVSLGAGNTKAAAFVHGGHIIMGYVEEPSITVFAAE
jgi:hypothetical protein